MVDPESATLKPTLSTRQFFSSEQRTCFSLTNQNQNRKTKGTKILGVILLLVVTSPDDISQFA